MYAKRFSDGPRFRPASLGAALAINAGVIAMILLAKPDLIPGAQPKTPIESYTVVEPTPPPPDPIPQPPSARSDPSPRTPVTIPIRQVETPTITPNTLTSTTDPIFPPPTGDGTGTGTGTGPVVPPAPPAFVAARQDPRYLGQFQPDYPAFERDTGREGVVKLRVLIGTDGRVKQVQPISGRDSFLRAATAQALAKWRFTPATRGDVPEDSWLVMSVRFTLND